MATVRTDDGVLGYVRALFRGAAVAGLGDAQLLERYRSRGDDEDAGHAFAALVARHGAMVFRACLAVSGDRADAEDAFQATFLVLARRARSLWVRDSLGPWLHTVAVRIAADARDAAERRRRHERRCAEMAATFAPVGAEGGDLRAVLHEEVARLPRKLRAPVVLCDMEGLTHEQAAGQLGCPVGTVKTRLTGARERLRGRLVRRGVAPAAGLIATTLAAEAAGAAVPAALTQATVHAAAAVRLTAGAAAAGVVAAAVDSLVKGALRAMILSRIKFVVMTLLTAAAVLGGAFACRGLLGNATADEKRPDPPAAKALALEVTVVDKRTGRPVGGASVKATLDEATRKGATDSAGRHVVTVPDTGVTYLAVHVRKEGYVPVVASWRLPRNDGTAALPASFTIPLEPATSISGLVKGPAGRPVAGATVYVIVPRRPATEPGVLAQTDIWDEPCPTDAQGRWRCNLVPSDLKAPWLRVVHADFVSKEVTGDDAALLASLRDGSAVISLARGLPVTGRVLDAQDRPVAGATVGLGESRAGWLFSETTADAEGRFGFAHTSSGRTVLTVQAKGHAPDLKEFEVVDGLPPLEFRLGPPRTVRGRVVSEAGEPVGGTRVVTDSWRGYRTIDIRTVADAEGRFRVDDLPDEVVEFQFAREGHMNLPNQRLTPSKEAVVTLTRPLTIRGTVTDAKTGQPVDRFTLYDANDPASGSDHWDRERPRPSRGGRYEITATWPYPTVRALRAEAEGYLPATSRGFKAGEGQVTYDFTLTPGSEPKRPAVTGVVLLPDGTPAVDAEVVLVGKTFAPYVRDGRPSSPRRCPTARTGRDGAFRFEPQTETVDVMAFHDLGFAEGTEGELAVLPGHALRLREWGRVEGALRVGAEPGADQEVHLEPKRPGGGRDGRAHVSFGYQARTDDQGRFVFERVVPGPASVSRAIHSSPQRTWFGPWFPVEVEPGETARVVIGGQGLPVLGRVVLPPGLKTPVSLADVTGSFRLAPPPVTDPKFNDRGMSKDERRAWYEAWSVTEEGRLYLAYEKDRRFYAFTVRRDGSFRIDDVVPGTYQLVLQVLDAPTAGRHPLAEAKTTVNVPPIPGGRSDEPLDLQQIELTAEP